MKRPLILSATVAALALGACGKVGALEQPAPLYGEKAQADYQAHKAAAKAKTAAAKAKSAPAQPAPWPDPPERRVDPYTTQPAGPMLSQPIPGAGPPPFGEPPAGALPNPMTDTMGPPR